MWGEMCECVWRMRVHSVCVDSEGVWCEDAGRRVGE